MHNIIYLIRTRKQLQDELCKVHVENVQLRARNKQLRDALTAAHLKIRKEISRTSQS